MASKAATVRYKNISYRVSDLALEALHELVHAGVSRDQALAFILRQEGYPA